MASKASKLPLDPARREALTRASPPLAAPAPTHPYALAALAVCMAALLHLALRAVLPGQFPYLFFVAAVLASVRWGGSRAGLAATTLGVLVAALLGASAGAPSGSEVLGLGLFALLGLSISRLFEAQRADRERAAGAVAQAETLLRELAREVEAHRHTDRLLREHRQETEALLDVLPVAVLKAEDAQCRFVVANRAAYELMGVPVGSDLSHQLWPHVSETQVLRGGRPLSEPELPLHCAAREGREVGNEELELVLPQGERRTVFGCAQPLRDGAGAVRGAIAAYLDITALKRTREALHREHARVRAVLQDVLGACYILDGAWRFTFADPGAERFLGAREAELLGRSIWDCFPSLLGGEFHRRLLRAAQDGAPAHFEAPWGDGDRRWAEVHVHLADEGMSVYFRDISPRKQMEAALRESEERFRVAQELSLDAFTILEALRDDEGRIADFRWVYANPAAARLLRRRREQLVGARLSDVLPGSCRTEKLIERYVPVVESGRTHQIELSCEADGIEGWFRSTAVRLGDGLALCFGDITEQKRGEDAIRRSESKFRALFDSDLVPMVFWHVDGRVLDANDAYLRLIGCRREDLAAGRVRWDLLTAPEWREEERRMVARLPLTQRSPPLEKEYLLPGGRRVPVLAARTLLPGSSDCGVGLLIDLTESKRAEAALRQADRRKDQFLAMLAHELRNPLAPIRNAVQVLRRLGPKEPRLDWARDVIDRQAGHLSRMVDDLLDVSRITRGTIELKRTSVELAALVDKAAEVARPLIQARRHRFLLDLPPGPVSLEVDEVRMVQVIANLLNNAAKYTDEAGEIRLSASRSAGEIVISVRDSGIGIPSELLPSIFELFAQADRSLDRSQGGLGIGLTLVRSLVELHGGQVEALSAGPGLGSEFIVRLPWAGAPAQAASASLSHPAPFDALRVLLVDDNEDALESLGMLLALEGCEVRTARDGPAALRQFDELAPQVLVLDIGLPGMDGYELAQRVRERSGGDAPLLVALTGYGQEADRTRSRAAGFDHHLVKPALPEELLRLIREHAAAAA